MLHAYLSTASYSALKTISSSLQKVHLHLSEACCLFVNAFCVSDNFYDDPISSCSKVIENTYLLVSLYILLIVNLIMNCLCVILKSRQPQETNVKVLGMSLYLSDSMMAIYLIALISVDHTYHGAAFYINFIWRKTQVCKILGALFTSSFSLSNISTLLITADRFKCIVLTPYLKHGFSNQQVAFLMSFGGIVGIFTPLLSALLPGTQATNASCILVGSSVPAAVSSLYITQAFVLFLSFTGMSAAVIKVCYKSFQFSHSKSMKNVIIRILLTITLNFISTLLIETLSVMSLMKIHRTSIEAFLPILVFPLIACVNPVVNTVFIQQFLSRITKYYHQRAIKPPKK